jgi:serine O-acetyltransferase
MKFMDCFVFDLKEPKGDRMYIIKRLIFDINFRVLVYYRLFMYLKKIRLLKVFGILLQNRISRIPGVEILADTEIGKGFSIQHPHDIVIGKGAVIKENVTIYNGVTLGARNIKVLDENTENRYPIINSNVTVFPGAKVLGNVTIGSNSIIGANSVVLDSFPENSIIAGNPAKLLKRLNINEN